MSSSSSSIFHQATAVIANRRGLHARASVKFARVAESFAADIEVARQHPTPHDENNEWVDAKSTLGLMMLAASRGTALIVRARGADARQALRTLTRLIADGFHES